jgi:hypothetical protein
MIQVLTGTATTINKQETFHYLGYDNSAVPTKEVLALYSECLRDMLGAIQKKAVLEEYAIRKDGDRIDLGFAKVISHSLALNLRACDKIMLFAATVGVEVDRLIAKYERLSPAKGAMMQALGAAAVEDWCDELNARITSNSPYGTKPRFSCGYGDLSLSLQTDIFAALSVTKRIGITLNDSLFMTPTKSVTAIVGIKSQP